MVAASTDIFVQVRPIWEQMENDKRRKFVKEQVLLLQKTNEHTQERTNYREAFKHTFQFLLIWKNWWYCGVIQDYLCRQRKSGFINCWT